MTISELARRHERIGLDTNVLIYAIEGAGPEAVAARGLLDLMTSGRPSAVLSILGLTELLVGPARVDDAALVHRYTDEIQGLDGVTIASLDVEVAIEAALLRANAEVGLADAIHLATARVHGASAFVTNDRRLRPIPGLDLVVLADLRVASQEGA